MSTIELFHFEDDKPSFEDYGRDNGFRYWYARDLMVMLGYEDYGSFKKAINKAMAACGSLNIDIPENFIQDTRVIDGAKVADYRLSKFACYLTAMNGDVKKPQVANAQAYFITLAEAFKRYIDNPNDVERVYIRDEITTQEKSLAGVAKQSGVVTYQFFQNAGYRGMYNMSLGDIKRMKGVPDSRSLLDFMGKQELAANLFRITETEAKIKNESIYGQVPLEAAAFKVGRRVRQTMEELSGDRPEELAIAGDIKDVKAALRITQKGFAKAIKPKRLPRP